MDDHGALRLALAHRCSSQARQTSGTPQVDLVAFAHPPAQVCWPPVPAGQPDRPVQGDPALEPAIGEVLAAAGFPDALVRLVPVLAHPVEASDTASQPSWSI